MNVGTILVGAVLLGAGAWIVRQQVRGEHRNAGGGCAHCGAALGAEASFYVEGRLVCARCAARTRRNLRAVFGVLALLTLVGVAAGAVLLAAVVRDLWAGGLRSAGDALLAVGIAAVLMGGVPLFFRSAVREMKAQNRRARAGAEGGSASRPAV